MAFPGNTCSGCANRCLEPPDPPPPPSVFSSTNTTGEPGGRGRGPPNAPHTKSTNVNTDRSGDATNTSAASTSNPASARVATTVSVTNVERGVAAGADAEAGTGPGTCASVGARALAKALAKALAATAACVTVPRAAEPAWGPRRPLSAPPAAPSVRRAHPGPPSPRRVGTHSPFNTEVSPLHRTANADADAAAALASTAPTAAQTPGQMHTPTTCPAALRCFNSTVLSVKMGASGRNMASKVTRVARCLRCAQTPIPTKHTNTSMGLGAVHPGAARA